MEIYGNYLQWWYIFFNQWVLWLVNLQVVNVSSSSTKLSVHVPKLHGCFQYYVLHITRAYFPVACFSICKKCPLHPMWTILYPGLHFKSHLPSCLFLKYMQSPILKDGGFLSMVFSAILNLFSSQVFFAMANANLCVSRFSILESGSLGNVAWVLMVDVVEGSDLFHILKRMMILQLPSLVLISNWWVLDSNIHLS